MQQEIPPQSAWLLQLLHNPPTHAKPPGQSPLAQHCAPWKQAPRQHFAPGPHSPSPVQGTHRLPVQISPVHSALLQQVPDLQPPPQQRCPKPHWASDEQGVQELLVQTLPAPHSALVQQLPSTHVPEQHLCPAPHWELEVHIPQ
jgi:hypothetical protein